MSSGKLKFRIKDKVITLSGGHSSGLQGGYRKRENREMNPVRGIVNSLVVDSPLPSNLTYLWGFGSILGLALVIQILTGVFLAMHYVADTELAFMSVEHIMRDTVNGWILRYAHDVGIGTPQEWKRAKLRGSPKAIVTKEIKET